MQELYIEGLATHDDPESCGGVREGDGEALTGARAGRAIEPRDFVYPGCRRPYPRRKATSLAASSELAADPARSENLSMCGISTRENREVPGSPTWLINRWAAQGRSRPHA